MNPDEFDLTEASRTYGIANTPPFLVRKLQSDPVVRAMSEACTAEEILEALRLAVTIEPANPVEAVRPYALLVALWFKPEVDHLREAAKLQAATYRWFPYIAAILVETFSPVQRRIIEVSGSLASPTVSVTSSAPTIIIPSH